MNQSNIYFRLFAPNLVTSKCYQPAEFTKDSHAFHCSHDGIRTIHHRDIREESLKRYSMVITSLLCFVLRRHLGWNSKYAMDLTPEQRHACEGLNKVLRAGGSGGDALSSTAGEQDWNNCLGDDDVCEEAFDEDDCDGGNFSLAESEHEPTLHQSHKVAENPIQMAILDLLISLYKQLPSGREEKFYSPIICFAVVASLRPNGQWLAPRRITHLFAILLFCGREVMMALMHQRVLSDPTLRYSK
jgi:hypothetical protein